jgi:catechol 2,3-dioxygenase-like lactoylglutathione lyase family enzyme
MSQVTRSDSSGGGHPFVKGFHGVRYQVKDVAQLVAFYTNHLGFKLQHQHLPAFATVSVGDTSVFLSGPEASGCTSPAEFPLTPAVQ